MSKAFHELFHNGAVHIQYGHAIFICVGLAIINVTTYLLGFHDCKKQFEERDELRKAIDVQHENTKKGLFN